MYRYFFPLSLLIRDHILEIMYWFLAGRALAVSTQHEASKNKTHFLEINDESQEERLSPTFRICMINVLITAVKSLRY